MNRLLPCSKLLLVRNHTNNHQLLPSAIIALTSTRKTNVFFQLQQQQQLYGTSYNRGNLFLQRNLTSTANNNNSNNINNNEQQSSTESNNNNNSQQQSQPTNNNNNNTTNKNDEQLEKLQQELQEMKQSRLYALAEVENVRRRGQKDAKDAKDYAITGFAKAMIDVADNLERAIELFPGDKYEQDETVKAFLEGIKGTERSLSKSLKDFGVEPFGKVGEVCDPNRYQVLVQVPDAANPPNTVVKLLRKGYTISGSRVLRVAHVVSATKPPGTT
jgi:molecular chaperone GrpE